MNIKFDLKLQGSMSTIKVLRVQHEDYKRVPSCLNESERQRDRLSWCIFYLQYTFYRKPYLVYEKLSAQRNHKSLNLRGF